MKKILKVMSLTMLATIGLVALVIGGMYLFGGFDEKPIYAQDLSFNSKEIITSNPIVLQVNTATEDVNKKDLVLYTSPGGEQIIQFPERIVLGEPFSVIPKFNEENKVNNGGVVNLFARYDGNQSNQSVMASCKILIDTPVRDIAITREEKIIKIGTPYPLLVAGTKLSNILSISPSNALIPYVNKSLLGNPTADSVFNFADKRIFLEIVNADKNVKVDAVFRVNGSYSKQVEVKYSINENNELVFTENIDILADNYIGEIYLIPYIMSTYDAQQNLNVDTSNFKDIAIKGKQFNINVINYSVDSITVDESEKNIYYNDPIQLFMKNPEVGANAINLNLTLKNNANLTINPALYKNNIYLSIDNKDIMGSLTKSDPSIKFEEGKYGINVDYTGISDEMGKWNWRYFYQDFLCYYKYKNNSINDNKIKINVTYYDGVNEPLTTYFYLTPKIREVTGIVPKYDEGQTEFTLNSGDEFKLTESNFEFKHEVNEVPTFPYLQFYIPFNASNNISTVPIKQNDYYAITDIILNKESTLRTFKLFSDWAVFVPNSKITFIQGANTYEWALEPSGSAQGDSILFEANVPIQIKAKIRLNKRVESNATILQMMTDRYTIAIKASQTRFYELNDTGEISDTNPLPYLNVNNVVYTTNFDFYIDTKGNNYIHIINEEKTISRVSGIGAFQIIAQLAYTSKEDMVYWLDSSIYVNVQVYEFLKKLSVFDWDEENSKSAKLPAGAENYKFDEENNGQTITKYLYITSDEKDALKRTFEEGLLNVSFEQDFQFDNINPNDYTSEISKSINQINDRPIEFSPLTPVVDKFNTVLGYKFSYTIRKIFTIELENGKRLSNIFNIYVTANDLATKGQRAIFIKDGPEEENINKLPIQINDKTLNYVELGYDDGSGSKDNPLKLTAKISKDGSAKLVWVVNDSQVELESLTGLSYGFKYSDKDEKVDVSRLHFDLTTNGVLFNESDFYRFTPNGDGKGGLTFNNVPYVEDGILFVMSINTTDKFVDNIFYKWDKNRNVFIETINKSLEDGKKLYLSVKGLQIDININEKTIVGNRATETGSINLFGADKPLFNIKGATGLDLPNIDYSKLFKMKVISSTQSDDYVVDEKYKKIDILKDFIIDETIDFQFYYGTEANALKIHDGEALVQRHTQKIKSAYTFNVNNNFIAPTNEPKPFVQSITYLGRDLADKKLDYNVSIIDSPYPDVVKITNNNLVIKSMTNSFSITLMLTVKRYNDEGTALEEDSLRQITYKDITITSKYSSQDVIFGSGTENNKTLRAGYENSIKLGKNFSLQGELDKMYRENRIDGISIKLIDLEPEKLPSINQHMKILHNGTTNVELYSYDLNLDKRIKVEITFLFVENGGSFVVEKELLVTKNLDIQLNSSLLNKKSGDIINLGKVQDTYVVTRNDIVLSTENEYLQETDFTQGGKYSKESFSGYEEYFIANTGVIDSVFDLQVKYMSGLENQNVKATFTFRYETNQHYYLYFDFTINLTIKSS